MTPEETYTPTLTDDCTGLHNAQHLSLMLEIEIYRCERYQWQFSLLAITLEGTEDIENTYGRSVLDALLAEIAGAVKVNCRLIDLPFHYGNGEFLILFPQMSAEVAAQNARNIHAHLAQREWLSQHGLDLRAKFSTGTVTWPDDGRTKAEILHTLDDVMYLARRFPVGGDHNLNIKLDASIDLCRENGWQFSLLRILLVGLKEADSSVNHKLIARVAGEIREKRDLADIGSDGGMVEFDILLPHESKRAATETAQQLCDALIKKVSLKEAPPDLRPKIVAGVAAWPKDGELRPLLMRSLVYATFIAGVKIPEFRQSIIELEEASWHGLLRFRWMRLLFLLFVLWLDAPSNWRKQQMLEALAFLISVDMYLYHGRSLLALTFAIPLGLLFALSVVSAVVSGVRWITRKPTAKQGLA